MSIESATKLSVAERRTVWQSAGGGPQQPARPRRRRLPRVCALTASLLVVVVATPAVEHWMSRMERAHCLQRIASLGRAIQNSIAGQKGEPAVPPAAIVSKDGKPLLSRRVALLPALGYASLYAEFALDEPWDSPHNRALIPRMPMEFACPAGERASSGRTHLRFIVGNADPLDTPKPASDWSRPVDFREFSDGTRGTILMLETKPSVIWTQPDELEFKPEQTSYALGSPHPGGAHALFVNGAANWLSDKAPPDSIRGMITRDGGEVAEFE